MQLLHRAAEIAEAVLTSSEPLGVMELARLTSVDKSTCSRIVAVLVERGWLERTSARKYRTGQRLLEMAQNSSGTERVFELADELVRQLRDRTSETVTFQRLWGNGRICIMGREGVHEIRRALPGPDPIPLAEGPSGKVILAFLPAALIEGSTVEMPPNAKAALLAQLDSIRENGFVSTDGDRVAGVGALSAPVFARDGVYGSLTVAGPSTRWDPVNRSKHTPSLLEAAQRLSAHFDVRQASRFDAWLSRTLESLPAQSQR